MATLTGQNIHFRPRQAPKRQVSNPDGWYINVTCATKQRAFFCIDQILQGASKYPTFLTFGMNCFGSVIFQIKRFVVGFMCESACIYSGAFYFIF